MACDSNLVVSRESIGEGDGTPLQYSCLENPMDGGAWWAAVHGVAKSQTWLSNFTFTFHFHALEKEMATPLQCSCLEDPRDGGAWWAAVYGVAQSWTRLKRLSSRESRGEWKGWGKHPGCGVSWDWGWRQRITFWLLSPWVSLLVLLLLGYAVYNVP